ncbi:carbamoyltransferase [Pelagibacteraceae bacterium]|nr:carbamoyltransferase [Pelagibacteraceae bacterium]
MIILGISAFYHDSAASLIIDGDIIAAAQEERFTRKKHDSSYPLNAVNYVLNEGKINLKDVDHIIFYEKPFLKFERLLETYLAFAPFGINSFYKSLPLWLKEKLFQKQNLINFLKKHENYGDLNDKIKFSEHHLSHAASAYFPSPFDEALVLTADGVGEWATTTIGIGKGNNIKILKEINFPHSLGLLYSAFTFYTGFKVNSGEYKLMGLAPYGNPKYVDLIYENLIDVKTDGSFRLNQKYFNYATGLTMISKKFSKLFGHLPRMPEEELTQFHMDIARSIQLVIEQIILKLCISLSKEYKVRNLCLAGGVALNCVANGKILESKIFENIWVQPASGDAGGSLGSALAYWHIALDSERNLKSGDTMKGSYLGPSYKNSDIEKYLIDLNAKYHILSNKDLVQQTAKDLNNQKIIGWFQGRMEFGPRALGNRSIIADPRSSEMQKKLNLKIKYRESFRPFAPSILREHLENWFELNVDSPYMLFVSQTNKNINIEMTDKQKNFFGIEKLNIQRSTIPAITHVDYTARIQTVHQKTNQIFHELISEFYDLTNCPVIVNTSFNVRGEPIVNSPTDAYRCFMGTEMDILVIGNYYLIKNEQNKDNQKNYEHSFEKD